MFKKAIATTFLLGISVNTVFASELQDKQIIMKLMNNYIFATVNQIKIIYLLGLAFAGFLMLNKRKT